MNIFGFDIQRARQEQRSSGSIEDPRVPVSESVQFMTFFGLQSVDLPHVTIDRALTVPAVGVPVTHARCVAAPRLQEERGR